MKGCASAIGAPAYLIGIDEAGYGPRFGPLVIVATVWRGTGVASLDEMDDRLRRWTVQRTPQTASQLPLGDSKQIYRSGEGLKQLERTVLGAWRYLRVPVGSWQQLWQQVTTGDGGAWSHVPWYRGCDVPLPIASDLEAIEQAEQSWHTLEADTAIALRAVRVYAIFPELFNDELRTRNKADLLTRYSMILANECLRFVDAAEAPVGLLCDRHGGRTYYAGALQHHWQASCVWVAHESPQLSRYVVDLSDRRVEIRFIVDGDQTHVPIALASMVAKYVRELAMIPFNAYWQRLVPGLQATSGYGRDADRFQREIMTACAQTKIAPQSFVRAR